MIHDSLGSLRGLEKAKLEVDSEGMQGFELGDHSHSDRQRQGASVPSENSRNERTDGKDETE